MKISSAPSQPRKPSQARALAEYQQAQQDLDKIAPEHFEKVESLSLLQQRVAVGAGVTTFVATAGWMIAHGIRNQALYMAGPAAVMVGAAVNFAAGKYGENQLEKTTLGPYTEARQQLVEKRQAYHRALLDDSL